MAVRHGWQDLDSIMDGLKGAAVAAATAGVSEVYAEAKDELRQAAPVGKTKRTVHFADPRISGGRVRPGGRTKRTVNFAYPNVDIVSAGDVAHVTFEAEAVMAPQGVYHDDAGATRTVRAHPPLKKLGWINEGTGAGVWKVSSTSFVGGKHRGWIGRSLARQFNVGARMNRAFAQQFTAGGQIRPQPALILTSGFRDMSGKGDWFNSHQTRGKVKDLALRSRWEAASRRALGQWLRVARRAATRFG